MLFFFIHGCQFANEKSDAEKMIALKQKNLELKEQDLSLREKQITQKQTTGQSQNIHPPKKNTPFYIVNISAEKTEEEATLKMQDLQKQGYTADYLWIPDYPSLSGASYYTVYIGPFKTQNDCEVAVENYKNKFPDAYGLLVSQESKRVRINDIGQVAITNNQQ